MDISYSIEVQCVAQDTWEISCL